MGRHQLAAVEDLHRLRRDARLHLLAQQPERHRVEVLVDLDVVVEVHPAALPVGIFIGRRRQRLQGGPVDLLIERASGGAPAAHRPVVELIDQLADRLVQLGQREEPPVAQPRQDPALHHLNADLHLRLVARLVRPRRDHRGAVVRRHVGVGAVDQRLVEAGPGDPGAQVVADDLPRHPADERQHVDVHGNPVRQRLRPDRFRKDVAGGPQHGDEDLGPAHLSGCPVDHLHGVTGEVDEHPLARGVNLPQRRLQAANPFPVELDRTRSSPNPS